MQNSGKTADRSKLQTVYFAVFLFLVIIPVTLIGIGTLGILHSVMLDSAVEQVHLAQENVSSVLTSEIKATSLQLAHLMYVNNRQVLSLAAATQTENMSVRYSYYTELTNAVNHIIKPGSEIMSLKLYMKTGESLYLKEEITRPYREIKKEPWYQAALANKDSVQVGTYVQESYTNVHPFFQDSFIIVCAMSPDNIVGQKNNIEAAALFIRSQADNIISNYNRFSYKKMGFMYITDAEGNILVMRNAPYPDFLRNEDGTGIPVKKSGPVTKTIVTIQPETNWKIVSVVDTSVLMQDFYRIMIIVAGITCCLLLLFIIFSRYFLKTVIHPVNLMIQGLEKVESGDFSVHIEPCGHSEVRKMIESFDHTVSKLKTVNEEKDLERRKKFEAELKALQSQINPHFLVNALTSIRFMAQVAKFESLRKMAEALIKILTCSFRSSTEFYTLREELDVIEGFIYIMKIRYQDNFRVEYTVDETCLDCQVPRLILQPLIENAVIHAFGNPEEQGCIQVTIKKTGEEVQIGIEDNGCGISEETIQKLNSNLSSDYGDYNENKNSSIGINNVNSRLILNFGQNYKLNITGSPGEGTKITFRIPYNV